jgi:subtilisin family serine protease
MQITHNNRSFSQRIRTKKWLLVFLISENNVDIFAPGKDVYATLPNGKYRLLSGTSMVSLNVAGVAELFYLSKINGFFVKHIIMDSERHL